MKKVLLALLVALLAVSLLSCEELKAADTLAPVTTNEPTEETEPPVTTTGAPVTEAPVVIRDSKYHLTGLTESGRTSGDFVFDIYANGAALVSYEGSAAEVTVPSEVEGVKVTLIDDCAFKGQRNITSVTLPEGILRIGKDAFYACRKLESITLPSSVTAVGKSAFSGCESLVSASFPDTLASVDVRVFSGCTSLKSFKMPSGIKSIPDYFFTHCESLETVTFAEGTTAIGNYSFQYCKALKDVTFPETLTSIGQYAFYECTSIDKVVLPESITAVPAYAFYKCSGIKSLELGGTATIGEFAFFGCDGFTSVELPEGVSTLGTACFAGCAGLVSFEIPESIKTISTMMFTGCSSLKNLTFASDATSIGVRALSGTGLEKFTVPATVTSIGKEAFKDCASLKTITFESECNEYHFYVNDKDAAATLLSAYASNLVSSVSVKEKVLDESGTPVLGGDGMETFKEYYTLTYHVSEEEFGDMKTLCNTLSMAKDPDSSVKKIALAGITESVFNGCSALVQIEFPESVVSIGTSSFSGCESLTEVTLSKKTAKIGKEAFLNCKSLEEIYLPDTVTDIGKNALGTLDEVIINETTGKSVTNKVLKEGFTVSGFTGSVASSYANANGLAFKSVGLYGCIPNADLEYEYADPNAETKTYKITGYVGTDTVLNFPSNIEGITVTAIADKLFENRTDITSVSIPGSVTYIGESAFAGCTGIVTLSLPKTEKEVTIGKNAFAGVSITEATLPEGLKKIPEGLFKGASALAKVTLPTAYESIGAYAFSGTALTSSFTIPDTCVSVGEKVLEGTKIETLTLPFVGASVTDNRTVKYLFGETIPAELKTVVISNIATAIADEAFRGCTGLSSITFGEGVKSIGNYALADCPALTDLVELKGELPTVGEHILDGSSGAAFFKYQSKYNDAVKAIKDNADNVTANNGLHLWNGYRAASANSQVFYEGTFDGVTVKILYSGAVTITGSGAMPDFTLENLPAWGKYAEALKTLKVTGVSSIGNYAFYGAKNLGTIDLSSSISKIGDYAFYGASLDTKVTFTSEGTIGAHAFEATGLKTFSVPAKITAVGEYAFANCANLTTVTFAVAEGAVTVAANAFEGTTATVTYKQ